MYKAIVLLLVLLICCGYLYISRPDKIVISEKGKVEGLVNKSRAILQGKKFWKLQLEMANEFLTNINAPQLPSSSEMQALYSKLREDQRLLDEKMKVLYTREEQMARMLRIKADSLEITGKWRTIDDAAEASRMQELAKIKKIIPLIEDKMHIVKPLPVPADR
jgi:hypothetical protein